jgi:hypothetical protein
LYLSSCGRTAILDRVTRSDHPDSGSEALRPRLSTRLPINFEVILNIIICIMDLLSI